MALKKNFRGYSDLVDIYDSATDSVTQIRLRTPRGQVGMAAVGNNRMTSPSLSDGIYL